MCLPGDISGSDVCAATNGLNNEAFDTSNTQLAVTWDASDRLSLKYIFGFNEISYHRTTDDDNTASQFHDRQFYVNHEARYSSHELQAFYEINDTMSVTSGVFWYDATIDQRGDFYSEVGSDRGLQNAIRWQYWRRSAVRGAANGNACLVAKNVCLGKSRRQSCQRTSLRDSNELSFSGGAYWPAQVPRNDNLYVLSGMATTAQTESLTLSTVRAPLVQTCTVRDSDPARRVCRIQPRGLGFC
jgi:hypothetical protein